MFSANPYAQWGPQIAEFQEQLNILPEALERRAIASRLYPPFCTWSTDGRPQGLNIEVKRFLHGWLACFGVLRISADNCPPHLPYSRAANPSLLRRETDFGDCSHILGTRCWNCVWVVEYTTNCLVRRNGLCVGGGSICIARRCSRSGKLGKPYCCIPAYNTQDNTSPRTNFRTGFLRQMTEELHY